MSRLSFRIHFTDQPERKPVVVSGRNAWAVLQLALAGDEGCTPIDNPAPRWSGYVFNLRQVGVDVQTIYETHKGIFPGCHARYVLRANIRLEPLNDNVAGKRRPR